MAAAYQTPGAYYERADAGAPPVSPLRMDIPVFIGIASRGPVHAPVPVESWKQFVAYFGDVTGVGYLAYSVRAFFENGGRRCWIVRVVSEACALARTELSASTPVWRISASSPGAWGNRLSVSIRTTHRVQVLADTALSRPEYVVVGSVSGIERGMLMRVRLATVPAATFKIAVVSAVDPLTRRVYWKSPERSQSLPYEDTVTGYRQDEPLLLESIDYTLLVKDGARVVAVYEGLSPSPSHPKYGPRALAGIAVREPASRRWSLPETPPLIRIEELRQETDLKAFLLFDEPVSDWLPLQGGWDGLAALTIRDFVGEADYAVTDEITASNRRGLACVKDIDEPTLVAIPDVHIQAVLPPERQPLPACVPDLCVEATLPVATHVEQGTIDDLPPHFTDEQVFAVQMAMVNQCETRRDRVALIDPPFSVIRDERAGIAPIRAWRRRFDSKFAAMYFPWLAVPDPLRIGGRLVRAIPPSGHVAGFIAKTDWAAGVHKAPANGELAWAQAPTQAVEDTLHGMLNEEGINLIRVNTGRGIRIQGARTLSSDPDWRYLNVRRLMIMIERSLWAASQWAVFEPNDFRTRSKLHLSFTSFLLALWQQGALTGSAPAEAFYVKCNDNNNRADSRARGVLLAEIGVAPSKPFEFVVLRVGRGDNQIEISEAALAEGVY